MSKDFGPTSYVDMAMQRARSISAARQDLPHLIFPKSSFPIDEHLIAAVRNSLYMMVFNIERSILRKSLMTNRIADTSHAYPILLESGLMNDSAILDTALYLFHYQNLRFTAKGGDYGPTPIRELVDRDDIALQKCIETMALGHSRLQSLGLGDYFELSPESIHVLTWRIVATFEILDGELHTDMLAATHDWLSAYDEAETISSCAGKLVYLLGKEANFENAKLLTYKTGNAALFIALLSKLSKIDRLAILNILTDRSPILSALLFRAVDMDRDRALLNISKIFSGRTNDTHNNIIIQIASEYEMISPRAAAGYLREWSMMLSYTHHPVVGTDS